MYLHTKDEVSIGQDSFQKLEHEQGRHTVGNNN